MSAMRANAVSVDVSKVLADFKNFQVETQKRVKAEINKSALRIQRRAKERCPVDTGRLRASIQLKSYNNGLTMTVGTIVKYAPYVEFGTYRAHAQPFLFPAAEEERPVLEREIKGAIEP